MTTPAVVRVGITPEAAAVLRRLRAQHGPLMFHQSGGCCDGSAPMCFPRSEFIIGDADVLLGVGVFLAFDMKWRPATPARPHPDAKS